MKEACEELEFTKVQAQIKGYCTSTLGENLVDNLHQLHNKKDLEAHLSLLEDAYNFLKQDNQFSISGLVDTEPLFLKLSHNEPLSIPEFLSFYQDVKISHTLRADSSIQKQRHPNLYSLVKKIIPTKDLEKRFEKTFEPNGEIKSTASEALSKIRHQYEHTKQKIYSVLEKIITQKEYKNIIQDQIITIRDRRYVIPIKEGGTKLLKGIIHDRSQSGASYFIEPLSIVDLNNTLISLQEEEKREIRKILSQLCNELRTFHSELYNNLKILQQIDFLNAAGKYSLKIDAKPPIIQDEPIIKLKNACHPLLYTTLHNKEKIVPFSLTLDNNCLCLVISGVNTGGKTVTLKAVGLITLMALSGLLVPAEEATIGIFSNIFTDINDEQSIEDSISTFASHIQRIRNILQHADSPSLVLIDELGTGTDPEEGVALAQAVLEELLEKKAIIVITTHLNKLKLFAAEHPLCENAAMRFDQKNLIPTYHLGIGFPGNSYALDIAIGQNLSEKVIRRAHSLLDEESRQLSQILKQVEQQRVELSQKITEYEIKNVLAKQTLESFQKKEHEWEEKEKELKKRYIAEAEEYLAELQQNFTQELSELKSQIKNEKKINHSSVKELKQKIGNEREKIEQEKEKLFADEFEPLSNPQPHELAFIKPLNLVGVIKAIDKNSVQILVDGITYKVNPKNLYKVPEKYLKDKKAPKKEKSITVHADVSHELGLELNIRGMTFDEARQEIDQYIDKALLLNRQKIRILHGKGTGQLRKKVWDYLKDDPRISEYYPAPENEGGSGVTIATPE
jgi:DNA mismatch repair protein MutS2